MSIYIHGIDMPTKQVLAVINPDGLVEILNSDNILIEEFQATQVPPHGRCIDADELIKVLKTKAKNPLNIETTPYSWAFAYECLIDAVGDMPTIIPAEEGE